MFGREQGSHALVAGGVSDQIGTAGDRDWFSFSAVSGRTYTVDLGFGSRAGQGTLSNGTAALYDALGRLVGTGSNAGGHSTLTFTAASVGPYYVVVTGAGAVTGTYRVSLSGGTAVIAEEQKVLPDHGPQVLPGEADAAQAAPTHHSDDQTGEFAWLMDNSFLVGSSSPDAPAGGLTPAGYDLGQVRFDLESGVASEAHGAWHNHLVLIDLVALGHERRRRRRMTSSGITVRFWTICSANSRTAGIGCCKPDSGAGAVVRTRTAAIASP